jgi:hypothetical protein
MREIRFLKYMLDGHTPVPAEDVGTWATWFETAKRHVADDTLGDVRVSTVFLGFDLSFGAAGPPVLFETMVFGGALDGKCERYSTWDEAEVGHEWMLAKVRGLL